MSSFEPGPLLLETRFVPDAASAGQPGFESASSGFENHRSPQAADPDSPHADDPERSWLKGYAAGRDAAREALPCVEAEALTRAGEALTRATTELCELRRSYLAQQRLAAVELAIAIAEGILRRELSADVDSLAMLVLRAAESLAEEGPLTLQLSDADHALVLADRASRLAELQAASGLELSSASDLQPGEFRMQAGSAEVDARIGTLLRVVREGLDECLANGDEAVPRTEGEASS